MKPTKEWATKEWKGKAGATSGTDSTQATKEWKAKAGGATTSSTDSRDSTQATKEWKARSDGSLATVSGADRTLATKEWKVQPGTKEWPPRSTGRRHRLPGDGHLVVREAGAGPDQRGAASTACAG